MACINVMFVVSIRALAVTSDNKYLISGSSDQSIKFFDLKTKEQVYHLKNSKYGFSFLLDSKDHLIFCTVDDINSLTVTPDGSLLIAACTNKCVKVFDIQTKQLVHQFDQIHKSIRLTERPVIENKLR